MARSIVILSLVCARDAAAQAWVPNQGEGSLAVLYQSTVVHEHLTAQGDRISRGRIASDNLVVDFTYGLTDRMAVTVGVPYFRPRYEGRFPHPTEQDNGEVHDGVQDLRFKLRYQVADGPVTLTPFIATNIPSHAYEYFAHAAMGTRVRELEVGAYVGRILAPWLPKTFVQGKYSYSFAEEIADIHHDRSNFDVEVGHFITPSVRVFALAASQNTHGGLDLPADTWRSMPPNLAPHHDRIGNIDLFDVGAGVQASVSKSVDVFASFVRTISGRNTHALSRALTFGASWTFGGKLDILGESGGAAESLVKCLCQKQ